MKIVLQHCFFFFSIAKRLQLTNKNKMTEWKTEAESVQLLSSARNWQLLLLIYKKGKKATSTCDADHKYSSTYH